ncbi:MAG: PRC-barrel domain-containing protein [Alphaproteobacteria bacterium]
MLKVVEATLVVLVLTATALATVMLAPAWSQGVPQTMGLVRVDPGTVATGYRASRIVGSDVFNTAGEDVGTVDDVIISNDGKVPYVVLAVGGFLGMGQRLVVVGSSSLSIKDGKIVIADASRDQLKALPEFKYAD